MQIDIVSDTVCPWCFIGKRKLEAALAARPEIRATVVWHPYQLNPDMPAEGMARQDYLDAKFGGPERAKAIYARVAAVGSEVGIPFDFAAMKRSPNTLASHCLLRWAQGAGKEDAVSEGLFRAFFIEGRDIGDHEVLVEVAAAAGMDGDLVRALLAEGRDRDAVAARDQAVRQQGIQGVPFFVIGGRYAISGAQDPSVFQRAFDAVLRDGDEAAAG